MTLSDVLECHIITYSYYNAKSHTNSTKNSLQYENILRDHIYTYIYIYAIYMYRMNVMNIDRTPTQVQDTNRGCDLNGFRR